MGIVDQPGPGRARSQRPDQRPTQDAQPDALVHPNPKFSPSSRLARYLNSKKPDEQESKIVAWLSRQSASLSYCVHVAQEKTSLRRVLSVAYGMLPEAVHEKIHTEWYADWTHRVTSAGANSEMARALAHMSNARMGDKIAAGLLEDDFIAGVLDIEADQALRDPKQYWIVHAQRAFRASYRSGALVRQDLTISQQSSIACAINHLMQWSDAPDAQLYGNSPAFEIVEFTSGKITHLFTAQPSPAKDCP